MVERKLSGDSEAEHYRKVGAVAQITGNSEVPTPAEVLLQEGFSELVNLYIATTRGPCGGVNDSLEMLDRTIELTRELSPEVKVFCLHQIIHNAPVLKHYKDSGVIFTNNLREVEPGSVCLINAHGQKRLAFRYLKLKGCFTVDATCPFVRAVQNKAALDVRDGYHIVLLGEPTHAEALGISSYARGKITIISSPDEAREVRLPCEKLSLHTQTTTAGFEAEEAEAILLERYPQTKVTPKGDRCTAVKLRQQGVANFKGLADIAIVVGSPTSKNTKNMAKVGEHHGIPTIRVDYPEEIEPSFLATHKPRGIAISSGASALDNQFKQVLGWLEHTALLYGREPNLIHLPTTGFEHKNLQNSDKLFNQLEIWLKSR